MESTSTYPAASASTKNAKPEPLPKDSLQCRVLAHLVMVYKWQPDYATRAAVYYSRINPYQLATMPDDLTREMLKLSDER